MIQGQGFCPSRHGGRKSFSHLLQQFDNPEEAHRCSLGGCGKAAQSKGNRDTQKNQFGTQVAFYPRWRKRAGAERTADSSPPCKGVSFRVRPRRPPGGCPCLLQSDAVRVVFKSDCLSSCAGRAALWSAKPLQSHGT